jgi:hypothetical protein
MTRTIIAQLTDRKVVMLCRLEDYPSNRGYTRLPESSPLALVSTKDLTPVTYEDVEKSGDFSFDSDRWEAEYFDDEGNLVDRVPVDELMVAWLELQPPHARTQFQPWEEES